MSKSSPLFGRLRSVLAGVSVEQIRGAVGRKHLSAVRFGQSDGQDVGD